MEEESAYQEDLSQDAGTGSPPLGRQRHCYDMRPCIVNFNCVDQGISDMDCEDPAETFRTSRRRGHRAAQRRSLGPLCYSYQPFTISKLWNAFELHSWSPFPRAIFLPSPLPHPLCPPAAVGMARSGIHKFCFQ